MKNNLKQVLTLATCNTTNNPPTLKTPRTCLKLLDSKLPSFWTFALLPSSNRYLHEFRNTSINLSLTHLHLSDPAKKHLWSLVDGTVRHVVMQIYRDFRTRKHAKNISDPTTLGPLPTVLLPNIRNKTTSFLSPPIFYFQGTPKDLRPNASDASRCRMRKPSARSRSGAKAMTLALSAALSWGGWEVPPGFTKHVIFCAFFEVSSKWCFNVCCSMSSSDGWWCFTDLHLMFDNLFNDF